MAHPAGGRHSTDDIAEKISAAFLEQHLAPRTKLDEDRLAAIFNSGRGKIRAVLVRLGNGKIIEPIPQRGAFEAKPSVEMARDVFETRRLIDPNILQRLLRTMDGVKLQYLQDHLALRASATIRGPSCGCVANSMCYWPSWRAIPPWSESCANCRP